MSLYDGKTSTGDTAHPLIDGNPTRVDAYTDATHYSSITKTFDDYGRVTAETDPRGKTTTTTFTPAVGWPTGGVMVTNSLARSPDSRT